MIAMPPLFAAYWLLPVLAQAPTVPADPLSTLRQGHPRLILTDEALAELREVIADHPQAAEWQAQLIGRADQLLGEPVTEFKIVGPRLLGQSRQLLDRVYTLGLAYRLTGQERYGRRAVDELAAAAVDWPHWNPSHFLDTAELNHAFGIGWDWLQPVLGERREAIWSGWLAKGLEVAVKAYRDKAWWARCRHNWNQVCNGGNAIAALAAADLAPERAREILALAVEYLPLAMHEYAPDGGWAEGPGYWHYATRYNVYVLAALETALGTDFGLAETPGFREAGDFRLRFVGPSGQSFNYADAGSRAESAEEMFWLARRFDRPDYAWSQRQVGGRHALDLIWFDPRGDSPAAIGTPLDAWFTGVQVGFLRGSWDDPDATWIGFKGGDNRANHSHLDLGSFVLDALGQRWVSELGGDNYNLPGYFGAKRWTYYRLNTRGQNTLNLDGGNQDPKARARGLGFRSTAAWAGGVVDLTAAWPGARRVHRGVALLDRRDALLVDELELAEPAVAEWVAHTAAAVTVEGQTATLRLADRTMYAHLLSPAGAEFAANDCGTAAPENVNRGITRLTVSATAPAGVVTRIAVLFSPSATPPGTVALDLAEWLPTDR